MEEELTINNNNNTNINNRFDNDEVYFAKTFPLNSKHGFHRQQYSSCDLQNKCKYIISQIDQDVKTYINNNNSNNNNNNRFNRTRTMFSDGNSVAMKQPKFQELMFMLGSYDDDERPKSLEHGIKQLKRFTKKGSLIHKEGKSKGTLNYFSCSYGALPCCNNDICSSGSNSNTIFKNNNIITFSKVNNVNNNNIMCYSSRMKGFNNDKKKKLFNRDYYKKELNSLSLKLFGNTKSKYQRANRNLLI